MTRAQSSVRPYVRNCVGPGKEKRKAGTSFPQARAPHPRRNAKMSRKARAGSADLPRRSRSYVTLLEANRRGAPLCRRPAQPHHQESYARCTYGHDDYWGRPPVARGGSGRGDVLRQGLAHCEPCRATCHDPFMLPYTRGSCRAKYCTSHMPASCCHRNLPGRARTLSNPQIDAQGR